MELEKYERLSNIFQSALMHMTQVLCEVRTTSQKMGVKPVITDPTVMPEGCKTDGFRNWVIFREYANQLQYMCDAFGTVHKNIIVHGWSRAELHTRTTEAIAETLAENRAGKLAETVLTEQEQESMENSN